MTLCVCCYYCWCRWWYLVSTITACHVTCSQQTTFRNELTTFCLTLTHSIVTNVILSSSSLPSLLLLNKFILHNQNKTRNLWHFDLFQRPSLEGSWYSVLLALDTMTSHCVKKAVVHIAELIAAILPIHGLLTFLTDVNRLLDPPGPWSLILDAVLPLEFASGRAPRSRLYRKHLQTVAEDISFCAALVWTAR